MQSINKDSKYQIFAFCSSRVRDENDQKKPKHYQLCYYQNVQYFSGFQMSSECRIDISLWDFNKGNDDDSYWIPTINDHISLFVMNIEEAAQQDWENSFMKVISGDEKPQDWLELIFIGQIMAIPTHIFSENKISITAQDVATTGIRRHPRGFRKSSPKLFGSGDKDLAIATVSQFEMDRALRNFYVYQNFIPFNSNYFKSTNENSEQSGYSVGLNSTGAEDYADLQRRNLLFSSYDFDGLSTVFNYDFKAQDDTSENVYYLRDHVKQDSDNDKSLEVDTIELRSEVNVAPMSTRYYMSVNGGEGDAHNIESDYFFNFGGSDGYEVDEAPGTSMDKIFGRKWNTMRIELKTNPKSALSEEYVNQIKFELDKLAAYRVFLDIMKGMQILATIHGIPIVENIINNSGPNERKKKHTFVKHGMRFKVEVFNNPVIKNIVNFESDDWEWIVSKIDVSESASATQGTRETKVHLVPVNKKIRKFFADKDNSSAYYSSSDQDLVSRNEYRDSFYDLTKWMRLPALYEDVNTQIKKTEAKYALNKNTPIPSIPSVFSNIFFTNTKEYKQSIKEQVWLCGMNSIV